VLKRIKVVVKELPEEVKKKTAIDRRFGFSSPTSCSKSLMDRP